MGPDFILTYYSMDFFPLLNRVMPFFFNLWTRILISLLECKQGVAEVDLVLIQTSFFSHGNYAT